MVLIDVKSARQFRADDEGVSGELAVERGVGHGGTAARGRGFESYRIGNNLYHVGVLPWWTAVGLWFMQVPWMVDLVVLAISFVFAIWIRGWLRAKARRRLQVVEG